MSYYQKTLDESKVKCPICEQSRSCGKLKMHLRRSRFFFVVFFCIFTTSMHSSNFLCSVHRLKLSEIKGAGGLVEPRGDSAGLSKIERVLCRFEAWDNRPDTGTVSMKPGTNKLVRKARLRWSLCTIKISTCLMSTAYGWTDCLFNLCVSLYLFAYGTRHAVCWSKFIF